MARFGFGGRTINHRAIYGLLCLAFIPYSAYVYTRGTEADYAIPMTDEVRHGQALFQEHNCIACHQFYGLGGYMGPDLTNVISNRGPEYARVFMMAGTPRMPTFGLDDTELDALIAYLTFVDSSGRYPAEDVEVRWYGTVVQNDE